MARTVLNTTILNSDIDSHINTGTASANEVLSYTGSDYDWVAQEEGVALTDFSVTTNSAGTAALSYNNSGTFTYTPPDLSSYLTGITSENLGDLSDVTITTAANGEVLKYNGTAWVNGESSSTITTSSTAPSSPADGDLWFSETNGVTYIYYNDGNSSQWVASGSPVLEQFQATGTGVGTLASVTSNGNSTSNNITVGGLTATSLNSLAYPSSDGTAGQFLKTNGSGTLSFDDIKFVWFGSTTTQNLYSTSGNPNFLVPLPAFSIQEENPTSISEGTYLSNTVSQGGVNYGGYIDNIPLGKWLVNGFVKVKRSDTGSSVSFILQERSEWAKYTIDSWSSGTGDASSFVTIPFSFIYNRTVNRSVWAQTYATYSSTQAQHIESAITMIRLSE